MAIQIRNSTMFAVICCGEEIRMDYIRVTKENIN